MLDAIDPDPVAKTTLKGEAARTRRAVGNRYSTDPKQAAASVA
jgi:hypothetical protein